MTLCRLMNTRSIPFWPIWTGWIIHSCSYLCRLAAFTALNSNILFYRLNETHFLDSLIVWSSYLKLKKQHVKVCVRCKVAKSLFWMAWHWSHNNSIVILNYSTPFPSFYLFTYHEICMKPFRQSWITSVDPVRLSVNGGHLRSLY